MNILLPRQDSHLVDSESRQPVTSPQPASSRLSNPAPLHSPPVSHHMRPMMSGRELPPTPSERDQRRDTLPPERQDRLSLGGPGKDHGKYSRDERFPDLDRRKSAPPERSTTLGDEQGGEREPHALPAAYSQLLGPRGYPSSDRSSSGDGGRWSLSQGNEHNHEQPHPFYGETAKPASVARPVPQHPSIRYVSNRQQRPIPQARPASVMGNLSAPQNHEDSRHEPNDSGSTLASVRPTGVREPPRMRAEPMVMSSNGPIHRENNDNGIERPKSVPPQLFYKVDNSPSPDGYSSSANPVPVPRRSRDMAVAEASRVGHVREPAVGHITGGRPGHISAHSAGTLSPYNSNITPQSPSGSLDRHPATGTLHQSSAYNGGNLHSHTSGSWEHPAYQQHTSTGSLGRYSGSPRLPEGSNIQQGQHYGQGALQSSRHSYDRHPSDPSMIDSSSIYATPQRLQGAQGRTQFSNQPNMQQSPQQRQSLGPSAPGPQQPYHGGMTHSHSGGGRLEPHPAHHPDQHLHGAAPTPTARILPQTKMPNSSAPRPDAEQRTAVGDDPQHDRPKQNSVWYEYGCV